MFNRKKYIENYKQNPVNKEKHRVIAREWQRRKTNETRPVCLSYYANGTPQCACCGEKTLEFLSLDHINGGGNQHKKKINKAGNGLYGWIIKNNFPNLFQVLCHNCNLAKGFYGKCPHQK